MGDLKPFCEIFHKKYDINLMANKNSPNIIIMPGEFNVYFSAISE
jgi:hypothetical protein